MNSLQTEDSRLQLRCVVGRFLRRTRRNERRNAIPRERIARAKCAARALSWSGEALRTVWRYQPDKWTKSKADCRVGQGTESEGTASPYLLRQSQLASNAR